MFLVNIYFDETIIENRKHKYGHAQMNMPRADFLAQYSIADTADFDVLNYEPSVGLYTTMQDGVTSAFQSPDEHPVLKGIHENIDAIKSVLTEQARLSSKPSDKHTWDAQADAWVVTAEDQAMLDAEKRLADATNAIQAHLDAEAQTRRYDGIMSLCTYATSPSPKFRAEGEAGVTWRDSVWSYATNVWAEVALGTRPEPTIDELIAELPTMVWPT